MTSLRSRIGLFKCWLVAPTVTGGWAWLCAIAAIALPTLVRLAVDNAVSGTAFSAYFPFVLLAAIFLGWKPAAAVTFASAAVADVLFIDPRYTFLAGPSDVFGIGVFVAASFLMIGFVNAARDIVGDTLGGRPPDPDASGIVFSLRAGEAWASWYGRCLPVHLGSQEEVAAMMRDFLAQLELGKRLTAQID